MTRDSEKSAVVSRILIVKPSSLGDIFHAFPAVSLLRKHYPDAEIDWLVNPAFADAIDFCPAGIQRKILFPRRELGRFKTFGKSFWRLSGELRRYPYDLIIDFQGLFRSAFFGWLARSHFQVGFAAPKEGTAGIFYRRRIQPDLGAVHAIERNYNLVQQLVNDDSPLPPLELPIVPHFFESAMRMLSEQQISRGEMVIGVTPGARWASKCWPPEFFARIIRDLLEQIPTARVLLLGSPSEKAAAEDILQRLSDLPINSLVGKTSIGELTELIRRCQVLISNDSGPIHLAAAMQVPVFAFFGPTDPALTGPFGKQNRVFQADLFCLKCLQRVCPRQDNACHQLDSHEITVQLMNHLKSKELL